VPFERRALGDDLVILFCVSYAVEVNVVQVEKFVIKKMVLETFNLFFIHCEPTRFKLAQTATSDTACRPRQHVSKFFVRDLAIQINGQFETDFAHLDLPELPVVHVVSTFKIKLGTKGSQMWLVGTVHFY
jgi:hypothetical protein